MATPEQVVQIVMVLNAMYAKDVAFLTEDQFAARTATYARLLADIDANTLSLAVDQYIAGGGKDYPSVKRLRDMALAFAQAADDAPDAATAWRQACNAVEPWGDGAQWRPGAKEKLHPRVVKAIEIFDMRRIALRQDVSAGTDFAQWRGLYESLAARAEDQAKWLPTVRDRIALIRAEMDAAKPAQIEAPEAPEPVRASAGAPMRISDVLGTTGPQLTKDQLDRRAHAARLIVKRDQLRESLQSETDEARRRAIEVQIDGITRTVAQYEVAS
jgi:hypothetical protein